MWEAEGGAGNQREPIKTALHPAKDNFMENLQSSAI